MERKKNSQKTSKKDISSPMRIPFYQKNKLKKIGQGNPREGLTKVLGVYDTLMANPERILMKDVDTLMNHLKLHYSDNHYSHFDNFPAVFRMFLKRGSPDFSIMTGKRSEKSLDEYEDEGGNNAE